MNESAQVEHHKLSGTTSSHITLNVNSLYYCIICVGNIQSALISQILHYRLKFFIIFRWYSHVWRFRQLKVALLKSISVSLIFTHDLQQSFVVCLPTNWLSIWAILTKTLLHTERSLRTLRERVRPRQKIRSRWTFSQINNEHLINPFSVDDCVD